MKRSPLQRRTIDEEKFHRFTPVVLRLVLDVYLVENCLSFEIMLEWKRRLKIEMSGEKNMSGKSYRARFMTRKMNHANKESSISDVDRDDALILSTLGKVVGLIKLGRKKKLFYALESAS